MAAEKPNTAKPPKDINNIDRALLGDNTVLALFTDTAGQVSFHESPNEVTKTMVIS
ncbi:hypothetical protein GCM10009007_00180 [Formosimonas limnophila]|uniref:Uncharacterized protein n=1 Tax=Formosimonas limnophila TaxID=1384487 RepID=A0A8J3FZY8_9BURK|nr:hypothetical protein [Formosimonas limnophila]GHA63857.1 hypothetical protein GCM10009007_00180 [Formosimonas limnophila]